MHVTTAMHAAARDAELHRLAAYAENLAATARTLAGMEQRQRALVLRWLERLGGPYAASGTYEFAGLCKLLAGEGIPLASGIFPHDRAALVERFSDRARAA